jgi:acetoin utilization deacetylase AcuC-like enzyme
VDDWRELGLPIRLVAPDPVAEVDLALAHDRDFVRGVLAGTRANGFGTTSLEVAGSLPFTSGSMLAAARGALESGGICCSPSSGFHHAGWARASGFCTFNGLAVTALALHRDGLASRVAILDCDQHYGDGTDDILDRTGARSFVHHVTAGADFHDPRCQTSSSGSRASSRPPRSATSCSTRRAPTLTSTTLWEGG